MQRHLLAGIYLLHKVHCICIIIILIQCDCMLYIAIVLCCMYIFSVALGMLWAQMNVCALQKESQLTVATGSGSAQTQAIPHVTAWDKVIVRYPNYISVYSLVIALSSRGIIITACYLSACTQAIYRTVSTHRF